MRPDGGWLLNLGRLPGSVSRLARRLRRAILAGADPSSLPASVDAAAAEAVLRAVLGHLRAHDALQTSLRTVNDALPPAPADPHLTLLDRFRDQVETDHARLELLAAAQHFPNATPEDRALFARAQHRIEHRLADYLRDAEELPAHRRGELMLSLERPLRRWHEAGVATAVIRASVLERALSLGVSIEEAERLERQRWE